MPKRKNSPVANPGKKRGRQTQKEGKIQSNTSGKGQRKPAQSSHTGPLSEIPSRDESLHPGSIKASKAGNGGGEKFDAAANNGEGFASWSREDKRLLRKSAGLYTEYSGKVFWDKIHQHFPAKSLEEVYFGGKDMLSTSEMKGKIVMKFEKGAARSHTTASKAAVIPASDIVVMESDEAR